MKPAQFFIPVDNQQIQCTLCPNNCLIENNDCGICGVRKNTDGMLYSMNYGKICSLNFDPIEKKPLYHFFPGKFILSIGSLGCNFSCIFCQNWEISQFSCKSSDFTTHYSASKIFEYCNRHPENIGLAYTYNEPTVWLEFLLEIATLAKEKCEKGIKQVMISNGYINPEPLERLFPLIDAFNIDLKAFTEEFYRKTCGGMLEPVKSTLKNIKKNGRHLEITYLLIPGLNDNVNSFIDMINWICNELGNDTVLHISRYFPQYHSTTPPTPVPLLMKFYEMAQAKLQYVYLGNVQTFQGKNTICAGCGKTVVERTGYSVHIMGLLSNGRCQHCGKQIVVS